MSRPRGRLRVLGGRVFKCLQIWVFLFLFEHHGLGGGARRKAESHTAEATGCGRSHLRAWKADISGAWPRGDCILHSLIGGAVSWA